MLKNKRYLIIGLIVCIIIFSGVFIFIKCINKGNAENQDPAYLKPVKSYCEGIRDKDINKVLSAFPDFMEVSSTTSSDYIDKLYIQYEAIFGANIRLDYSLGEAVSVDEQKISEVEQYIKENYDNMQDIDITAGYKIPVRFTITGDGIASDISNNTENTVENTEKNTDEESTENVNEDNNDNVSEDNTENVTEENNEENAENVTEENTSNPTSTVEDDEMYVFEYNGNWYIM